MTTWQKIPNYAMYKWSATGTQWDNEIGRTNCASLEDAQTYASDPSNFGGKQCTFFFYMREYMFLEAGDGCEAKGAFNPGDAVFFDHVPWWGTAPQGDGYVNATPPTAYEIEINKDQIGFITCESTSASAKTVTLSFKDSNGNSILETITFSGQGEGVLMSLAGGGNAFQIPAENNPTTVIMNFSEGGDDSTAMFISQASWATSSDGGGSVQDYLFSAQSGIDLPTGVTLRIEIRPMT